MATSCIRTCLLLCLFSVIQGGASNPFWPEENCMNHIHYGEASPTVLNGLSVFKNNSAGVNLFSSQFQMFDYGGGRHAGPLLNDSSTPCRLTAYVGRPLAFTVYAESLEADVSIYVLEDPGVPNGAQVTANRNYQRCVSVGGAYPCPMCQNFGTATFGFKVVPDASIAAFIANKVDSEVIAMRTWCSADQVGKAESNPGRLVARTLTWTPGPSQAVCSSPSTCSFTVKFQAFDSAGRGSSVKTVVIDLVKPAPSYYAGTVGMVIGGRTETFTDPVSMQQSVVSSTTFEATAQWVLDRREYKAYINCPIQFAMGISDANYDVYLEDTTKNKTCTDVTSFSLTETPWTDRLGRTCDQYVQLGFCRDGAAGANFVSGLGGSFSAFARIGGLAANQACCACGAGSITPCSSSSTSAACEPTSAAEAYPRHQCLWDQMSCRGTGSGFFVSPGELSPPWRAFSNSQQGNKVVAVFQWTPLRGMEGQTHQVCMRGSHVGNSSSLAEVCAFLKVMKCYYCTRVGETLNYVAEQYNFDTNWLRLWNFNPDIQDPDLVLRNYLPVVIGSTYKVQLGDTLSRVAARLRTTIKKILEVNPDMTSTDLFIDQEICVMPCTENPYAAAPLNPYIPQSIFGLSSSFVEQIPRISKDPRFP
ncbi:hypothetical protein GUITHDRAFT_113391 [Guillardia theta CCMP2712]|uniref:LysM domain-containing protein n=1 Tax=Guillardia theta (strain CCMP2712) TaxID=905079 RepID=L1IXN5_GUITC|nr:hypothetical protein GUITHDRAFT_113391 [Guillardia theta CCMP2712]EKX40605.1 hypothetical protein GUITHDRAFT_113391 [Guillardia theta CCMP2712]|eukprot:XP_005827585.1 hypothetical protein GUITHDRAFT_113391 [Guillardia theta CCMP2712]